MLNNHRVEPQDDESNAAVASWLWESGPLFPQVTCEQQKSTRMALSIDLPIPSDVGLNMGYATNDSGKKGWFASEFRARFSGISTLSDKFCDTSQGKLAAMPQ